MTLKDIENKYNCKIVSASVFNRQFRVKIYATSRKKAKAIATRVMAELAILYPKPIN